MSVVWCWTYLLVYMLQVLYFMQRVHFSICLHYLSTFSISWHLSLFCACTLSSHSFRLMRLSACVGNFFHCLLHSLRFVCFIRFRKKKRISISCLPDQLVWCSARIYCSINRKQLRRELNGSNAKSSMHDRHSVCESIGWNWAQSMYARRTCACVCTCAYNVMSLCVCVHDCLLRDLIVAKIERLFWIVSGIYTCVNHKIHSDVANECVCFSVVLIRSIACLRASKSCVRHSVCMPWVLCNQFISAFFSVSQ